MKFKTRRIILLVSLILLIIILGFLIMFLINKKTNDKFKAEPVTLSFKSRLSELETFDTGDYDKFGWLQVQGTHIDLPILNFNSGLDYDGISYSYGWLSPYYSDGENRKVLLGHNILNVSNEPMLPNEELANFEELMAFTYEGFARDNLYIQYTENGKDELYKIYAVGFFDAEYDYANGLFEKDEINEYIKTVRSNSLYDYDVDVNTNDTIITIKTCTRYFGLNDKTQFQIDARKVRNDEKIETYQVKTTEMFEKLNLSKEKM